MNLYGLCYKKGFHDFFRLRGIFRNSVFFFINMIINYKNTTFVSIICLHIQNIIVTQYHTDFIYLTRRKNHVTPYFGNKCRARISAL